MSEDPAPEGYLSLTDAFRRYCVALEKEPGALVLLNEFAALLRNGRLAVITRDPEKVFVSSIPKEAWVDAWYPQRPIIHNEIGGREGDRMAPHAGRTPFVREVDLDSIIAEIGTKQTPRPRPERYPWKACHKDFDEHVAENGTPTIDGGEPGWRSLADAERWVASWMRDRLGPDAKQPATSTVRNHTRAWLENLRSD